MRKFQFAHIHEIWYHARILAKFHASRNNFCPNQASRTNISTPSWYVIKGGLNREENVSCRGGTETTRDRLRMMSMIVLRCSWKCPSSPHRGHNWPLDGNDQILIFLICNQGRAQQRGECILSRWYWNNARQIKNDVNDCLALLLKMSFQPTSRTQLTSWWKWPNR